MFHRQKIQENRFILVFDKHASKLKNEAHEFSEFLKKMPIKSQYVKQLVIELDHLFEAHGLEIKKPLSRIAFLINKLQPFFSNKEVWFESFNQEQLQIMQIHLLNMNLSLIDTLGLMSQIDEE